MGSRLAASPAKQGIGRLPTSTRDGATSPKNSRFAGLRFALRSGCFVLPPVREDEEQSRLETDPRAKRARAILLWLTAALIVLPFAVWYMVERRVPGHP